jgi:hypothetical protein
MVHPPLFEKDISMWEKLTALYQRRYWLFFGLVLGWLLMSLAQATAARAAGDCAQGLGGQLGALARGAQTSAVLVQQREKAGSDVYTLLARAAPFGSPVAKLSLASSAVALLNCAALENADQQAASLRVRLAGLLDVAPRKVTASAVQKFYLQRLQTMVADQQQVLSPGERQVWADVLAYAGVLEGALVNSFRQMAADLRLPPPSLQL